MLSSPDGPEKWLDDLARLVVANPDHKPDEDLLRLASMCVIGRELVDIGVPPNVVIDLFKDDRWRITVLFGPEGVEVNLDVEEENPDA